MCLKSHLKLFCVFYIVDTCGKYIVSLSKVTSVFVLNISRILAYKRFYIIGYYCAGRRIFNLCINSFCQTLSKFQKTSKKIDEPSLFYCLFNIDGNCIYFKVVMVPKKTNWLNQRRDGSKKTIFDDSLYRKNFQVYWKRNT